MLLRTFCLLFVVALFLPTLQHSLNILPAIYLAGKETEPPSPSWSITGWLNGTFQNQYTNRRIHRLGLRDYFIKTYNQLHYTLFNRVVSSTGTNVVIGREGWLYEKVYIDKLNTPANDDGSLIDARVHNLRLLQDRLEEMGISFVFIIAPSKAEVYPEYIPEKLLKKPLPPGASTDYRQARVALERQGVNFVDSHTLFLEEKQKKSYQLFGPAGVHWNKYGAYLAWKSLASRVNEQIKVPLRIPPVKQVESRPSEPLEADLGRLLNLWNPVFTSRKTDYPVFAPQPVQGSKKPSILIIGDSFLFTLIDIVAQGEISTDVDAWYYFKRHFNYPAQGGGINISTPAEAPMDQGNIDWHNQLLNKNLVVLVQTEYWLPELGFGFVEEALTATGQLKNSLNLESQ